jgi:hypothetical protein
VLPAPTAPNPVAPFRYHPRLNVLYVLSECIHTEGYLTAFAVDTSTGSLTQLGAPLPMTGRSTCYISFDKVGSRAAETCSGRRGAHAPSTSWPHPPDCPALDPRQSVLSSVPPPSCPDLTGPVP